MKANVVVLGVSRYSFPDQNTGKTIEGTKVNYVEQASTSEDNIEGHIPQTAVMSYEHFDSFIGGVPGVYEAEMAIKLTGKKPTLTITGFKFVEKIAL